MSMLNTVYVSCSYQVARIIYFRDVFAHYKTKLFSNLDYIEDATESELSDIDSHKDYEQASEFENQNLNMRLELIKAQMSYN